MVSAEDEDLIGRAHGEARRELRLLVTRDDVAGEGGLGGIRNDPPIGEAVLEVLMPGEGEDLPGT